jgi:hypothetical protein
MIMTSRLFACVLAGALMAPRAVVAGDVPGNAGPQETALALPPIPYLETIPWLTAKAPKKKSFDAQFYHGFGVARFTDAVRPPVVRYSAISPLGATIAQ